ncbi:MAG: HAMP domain-containing sensor histidine kinase [Eubacteriales bacterium]|nr:HAMP domain-containing sensor histidine kinase [Eubacteriales bacterium]
MRNKPTAELRKRISAAFISVVLIPLIICTIVFMILLNQRLNAVGTKYGFENPGLGTLYNSNILISNIVQERMDEIRNTLVSDKPEDEIKEQLASLSDTLIQEGVCIVVRKGDTIYFTSDTQSEDEELLQNLPAFRSENEPEGEYIQVSDQVLFKQKDFVFQDGTEGSIFLLCKLNQIKPSLRNNMIELLFLVLVILIVTCVCMAIWIYRSIMDPIAELQKAAQNIRDGNLNYEVRGSDVKEMNDLCRDFEEMRIRLKESSEEKVRDDGKNRELVSNISHDLKTPVTAIKGYVEGLLDGVATTPEKQEKYLRTIYNKTVEITRLIDELTIYSKIDTNRIPYNFAKIHVQDYFEDCQEELRMELEPQGIQLNYQNLLHEDAWIVADPEQLRRVINNIIGNSVKYMDKKDGRINIRLRDVGDFIQCEIEDNGKGIEYKDIAHIFDRFYRSDTARSSKGGSGIGLSIVKKILEDHEGKVWATSKEGVGTVIYFVLRKHQEVSDEQNTDH